VTGRLLNRILRAFGLQLMRVRPVPPRAHEPLIGRFPRLDQREALGPREDYFIQRGYRHRDVVPPFDDTVNTDAWQLEVYQVAREFADLNHLRSVLDIGCGSGHKLLKFFGGFQTVGTDVPSTAAWLRRAHPDRTWQVSDFSEPFGRSVDLIIAADVIEHLADPDALMRFVASIDSKMIVLSTPDRNLNRAAPYLGPPDNPYHVREWSFAEFDRYVSEFFTIREHFISNPAQCTQCVVCERTR
jgi:SAM-dependent methyltransferase